MVFRELNLLPFLHGVIRIHENKKKKKNAHSSLHHELWADGDYLIFLAIFNMNIHHRKYIQK